MKTATEQAQDLAAKWADSYFANRQRISSANDWRQIYDAALGHFLKLANAD